MTAIAWAKPGTTGNWKTAGSWQPAQVPGATDDVTLGASATAYTVTIGTSDTVNSVNIQSGAKLTVSGDSTVLSAANGIRLAGGELAGGGSIGSTTTIGGYGTVSMAVDSAAIDTASGGTLEFKSSIDATSAGTFDIAANSTLAFDNAVGTSAVDPTVAFTGSDGTLDLSGEGRGANNEIAQFDATVSGFGYGDQLVVKGATNDTVSYDSGTNVLTVTHDGGTARNPTYTTEETVKLAGNYAGETFSLNYDSATGNDTITVCFMAGTLVRTPDGEVAVETLKAGDRVVTASGSAVPVAWLGRQTVSTRFADPLRVLPVRIKTSALDEGVPARDLLVSPDHAIFVDGVLTQAGALLNGRSIVRESNVPTIFTYYHIEVADHSLILAENTPVETFIDNVDRLAFDNWDEHKALCPDGQSIVEMFYPRAKAHRQVPRAIRERLSARAFALAELATTASRSAA